MAVGVERRVDQGTTRQRQPGNDALFCILGGGGGRKKGEGRGEQRKVKMSSDVAAVMKREAND